MGSYAGIDTRRMIQTLRSVASNALRLERRNAEPLFVIRCSLGVAIGLLGGFLTGHPLNAVAAAMGAMSTGFASLQGVYRTRAATMVAMATAMGFSAIVGAVAVHHPWLKIFALACWGLTYGLFASLGPAAAGIFLNATIALIVFSNFSVTNAQAVETALSVFAGGLIQTLLLVILWPVQRYPEERRALASAYRALAEYARHLGDQQQPFPASSTLESVRKALADPRPFGRRTAIAAFQALLNEAERLRGTLTHIAAKDVAAFRPYRERTASVLNEIADALEGARAPALLPAFADIDMRDALLLTLSRELKTALRYAAAPIRGLKLGRESAGRWTRIVDLDSARSRLRSHLSLHSPFGRHAVRLGVTLALAVAIGERLPALRGYWIALTAVIILRPDFTSTFSRGFARIGGTVVGVLASTAIVLLVPDTPHVSLALAILFATLGYAVFQINYAVYSLCITAYVVFIISLTGSPERSAILNRLIATSIGSALAMFSYVVWPTWEAAHTRARFHALLQKDREYSGMLFEGLADPPKRDAAELSALRYKVWAARAAAEESLERMLAEPETTHELDSEVALEIAHEARRLGLVNIALASLYSDPATPALQTHGISAELDFAISSLVEDLSDGNERKLLIRAHLDNLSSSIDAIAEMLSADQKP